LRHDVGYRVPVLHAQRHEDSRHNRKMEGHVAFVAFAEIRTNVGRPLVRLRKKHARGISLIQFPSDSFDDRVRLRKILAVCSVTFDEIRNRIQTEAIHSQIQPKTHRLKNAFNYFRIVEIKIRLVRKKSVPVIGIRNGIPSPVRFFRIGKNNSNIAVLLVGVAPNVDVAFGRAGRSPSRHLKPGMLVGSVIDNEFDDDPQVSFMGGG
jgi:hypothetical protein